ncbi:MAG TPA: type II toxin-antitoxin system prevent-host-death family antitoxin [Solirubrobacterales bacterium]|nr:type II toxin-antitoxin system prevent-host-death family antitoxin [Solirubrobacterales bacterium]
MAASVNIHEAKTQFSKLVRRAEEGEEIVVRRGKDPVAQLGPLKKKRGGVTGRGSMKGEFKLPTDEEWKKMDEEIERMFEESEVFPGEDSRPKQS